MNKQEALKRVEAQKKTIIELADWAIYVYIVELIKSIDEPETGHADEAPRYLKNILARLRELPLHNREVWLKVIMSEFKQDFSHAKWREGYEQGKVEGMVEREKVKVPQFVAQYIEQKKDDDYHLLGAMIEIRSHKNKEIDDWFYTDDNIELFARAWLDGYEVEKEKRYTVKIIGITNYNSYLNYHKGENKWTIESRMEIDAIRTEHTRKELEEAGFGEVFNSPLFEVEEVE